MRLLNAVSTLRFIWNHPLSSKHRLRAFGRFLQWQVVSRCLQGNAAILPFTENTQLAVARGMHGATGNIYLGLHEFSEMGFLLHFLRSDDLFFDVGANVGSYTILAAGENSADCIACEPVPSTFRLLKRNVAVNNIGDRVQASMVAVGETEGTICITTSSDTMNHVVQEADLNDRSQITETPVVSVDQLAKDRCPTLIKIDVEGYERHVLAGAEQTLADQELKAIIIELSAGSMNESCKILSHRGFAPFAYDPCTRELQQQDGLTASQNAIYVRESSIDAVRARLKAAKHFHVHSNSI